MKIKINNFNKAELLERKRIIEELLNIKETEMELNEENIKKSKEIVKKYSKVTTDNLNNQPIKIIVANSKEEIIATIK